jgi:acetyl esterase
MRTAAWLTLLACLLCGCATNPLSIKPAGPATPAVPDRLYPYKTVEGRKLYIHMDYPPDWQSTDRRPVIVFFFGGGWSVGTVRHFEKQAQYFASRGLVAARADYRVRTRDHVAPDKCVEDARSAVRWLRENADRLGIDPQRLIAAGGSAGGHLAACTAIPNSVDTPTDDLRISTVPQAMILFNPVVDFFHEQLITRIDGNRELAHKISPTFHLDKRSPPALLLFGTADPLKAQGDEYRRKAAALGVRVDEYAQEGLGHAFFNNSPWMEHTLIAADRFLASLGYIEGEPTVREPSAEELERARERDRVKDQI